MKAAFALLAMLLACSPEPTPAVTVSTPEEPAQNETRQPTSAKTEYDAAEALFSDAKLPEARAAFAEVKRKFAYSRWAPECELRIAQIDDKLGRPEAAAEFRAFAHDHPRDPRSASLAHRAQTIGDTTCHADSDCTTTTKHHCCECCPSGPYATSRQWLTWSEGECGAKLCGAVCPANAPCTTPIPPSSARCTAGSCELAP